MESGDEIRDVQRTAWAGLSVGWEKWDSIIIDQLRPVGTAMIESLDIADDQHHLDIAAGTGEPGLSVAQLAPRGHVVLTDLAAEMLDTATRRASTQGLSNFATAVCSADELPFDDATFDSVSVRFGYMSFLTSPRNHRVRARTQARRSAQRGGMGEARGNPWTTIVIQAIATETVLAPPDPNVPNMFRCAAPGYVRALYAGAGLHDNYSGTFASNS